MTRFAQGYLEFLRSEIPLIEAYLGFTNARFEIEYLLLRNPPVGEHEYSSRKYLGFTNPRAEAHQDCFVIIWDR